MRLFIGIIVGFLLATTLVNADLVVKGSKVIYTGNVLESGKTITEGETAPSNPMVGDIWRDITDGTIYAWNGTAWIVRLATQDIKDEITIFKNNIEGVSDINTKRCLKSLKKMILRLYKEE